jgi:tetratricopeptide (TPR) repeat protein
MRNRLLMWGFAALVVAGGAIADTPKQALQEANSAYLRGNYAVAARALEPFASHAAPRRVLAGLYVALGRYVDAEAAYREIPEASTGLATALQLQGRYAEAEQLLGKACEQRVREVGIDNPEVADCFAGLAELARLQGRLDEAQRRFWQAYQVQRYLYGEHGSPLGRTLAGLGRVASARGDASRAGEFFARALAIAERPARTNKWGRLDEREFLLLMRTERESSASDGLDAPLPRDSDHPDFARHLDHLAELYAALGRNADARAMLERSIAIREKAFGPGHPEVANSRNALKSLY